MHYKMCSISDNQFGGSHASPLIFQLIDCLHCNENSIPYPEFSVGLVMYLFVLCLELLETERMFSSVI